MRAVKERSAALRKGDDGKSDDVICWKGILDAPSVAMLCCSIVLEVVEV